LRTWLSKTGGWALAALLALGVVAAAQADKIRTAKGIGYDGRITGIGPEGLTIDVAGAPKTVALGDIREIEADKYPDLAGAEKAYADGVAGKPKGFADAERLYRSLLGSGGAPQWLRVLAQSRMYALYAGSGRTSEALDAYLEMARSQPKLVVGLKLPAPSDAASPEVNAAMLKKVNDAIRAAGDKPYVAELKSLQVGLTMLAGRPEEVLPLLEPLLSSPDEKTRQMAMLKELELLVVTGRADDAARRLEQTAAALGEPYAGEMAYWRGRVAQLRGENMQAALEYMRLPILYPARDKGRTAEALWRAGQAMEAGRAPRAEVIKVYTEAVKNYAGTAGAERAKREMVRLGGP